MSEIKESVRLIMVSVNSNNNKFWNADLYEDGHYEITYARVGAANPATGSYDGEGKFRSKIKAKLKKGYVEQKTVQENVKIEVKTGSLESAAKKQIKKTDSPVLDKLLDRLITANIHQITSNTQIQFNDTSGVFQTPLGVVTLEGIKEAAAILDEVYNEIDGRKESFYNLINEYLKIVPQKVGRNVLAFIDKQFATHDHIRKQKDLLDSLEISFNTLHTQTPNDDGSKTIEEKVFDLSLDVLADTGEFERLKKGFYDTRKSMHHYSNVHVKQIYDVRLDQMDRDFDKKSWGNIQEFYHGTNIANCLSIMKSGLKTAPPSSAHIAGKMFQNGVYGANCSSKSLGYSMGRWGGGSSSDGAWLFVCEFAMGSTYHVKRGEYRMPSGYDSISALSKNTSLMNDEFIVYDNNQVNIKYLIECEIK
jgi:poly [ADP-ribose] polymerase